MSGQKGRGFLALVMVAGLVGAALAMDAPRASAGQARAQFTASIRIDPELVKRDRERLAAKKATGATRTVARAAPARAASAPRVLPLAGGGACVRAYYTATRFRWLCR